MMPRKEEILKKVLDAYPGEIHILENVDPVNWARIHQSGDTLWDFVVLETNDVASDGKESIGEVMQALERARGELAAVISALDVWREELGG
jgi:hypothetical protein